MLPVLLHDGSKAWMGTGSYLAGNTSDPDRSLVRDEIPVGSKVAEQATRTGDFAQSTKSENSAGRSVDEVCNARSRSRHPSRPSYVSFNQIDQLDQIRAPSTLLIDRPVPIRRQAYAIGCVLVPVPTSATG